MQIIAKELSYTYSPKSPFPAKALQNVTLTINEGEFFGIIGHTGSGKSTFVQHLNGLIAVQSGSLWIGDFDLGQNKKIKKQEEIENRLLDRYNNLSEIPEELKIKLENRYKKYKKPDYIELRQKVGMVFQYPEYQLFAETVFDDVAFGLKNFIKLDKNLTQEQKNNFYAEAVKSALLTVGLDYDEIKDKSPFDLSGGQKRRVAIAGVIVTKPEILILDEPAAGLDPVGKKEVMELLQKLKRSWCKTVIVVSHDMDEVVENCTRVAVFADGKLESVSTPKELFKRSEKLIELGLDIPVTAKCKLLLEQQGIDIETDFTADDFANKVLQKYKEIQYKL